MALKLKIFVLTLSLILFKLLIVNGQGKILGEKYYLPYTIEKVSWYRAYQLCAKVDMQLASIETEDEWQLLKNNSITTNSYWLSGSNLANRNEYSWVSIGKTVSLRKWANNQPGTLANRCMRTNNAFEFVTDDCYALNYFICSKPVVITCGIYGGCDRSYLYSYN